MHRCSHSVIDVFYTVEKNISFMCFTPFSVGFKTGNYLVTSFGVVDSYVLNKLSLDICQTVTIILNNP